MKTCRICSIEKTLDQFHKASNRSKDGFRNHCKSCHSEQNKQNYKLSRIESLARSKDYYQRNKELRNRQTKEWYRKHPEARNYKSAAYRARKLNATPKWLTEDQLNHIALYYATAKFLSEEFKTPMQVDHQIPLKGTNVSGLHVPWNLQIMARSANCQKSNKV